MSKLVEIIISIFKAILASLSGGKDSSGRVTTEETTTAPVARPKKGFKPGIRTLHNLEGVHDDLKAAILEGMAISYVDFTVTEGLRSIERQKELVASGKSTTMNSRHLTGHAADIVCYDEEGNVTWDMDYYRRAADAILKAGSNLNVSIEWGGNWTTFKDGPHFQLSWKHYPA